MLLSLPVVPSLLLGALFMSALSSRTQPCLPTLDGFHLLQTIKNRQPTWGSETMLYTPRQHHYQSCPGSTLSCMRSELKVLLDEWTIPDNITKKMLKVIKAQIPKNQSQVPGCLRCEQFPEEPAETFLDVLNTTLQQINSRCSTVA